MEAVPRIYQLHGHEKSYSESTLSPSDHELLVYSHLSEPFQHFPLSHQVMPRNEPMPTFGLSVAKPLGPDDYTRFKIERDGLLEIFVRYRLFKTLNTMRLHQS